MEIVPYLWPAGRTRIRGSRKCTPTSIPPRAETDIRMLGWLDCLRGAIRGSVVHGSVYAGGGPGACDHGGRCGAIAGRGVDCFVVLRAAGAPRRIGGQLVLYFHVAMNRRARFGRRIYARTQMRAELCRFFTACRCARRGVVRPNVPDGTGKCRETSNSLWAGRAVGPPYGVSAAGWRKAADRQPENSSWDCEWFAADQRFMAPENLRNRPRRESPLECHQRKWVTAGHFFRHPDTPGPLYHRVLTSVSKAIGQLRRAGKWRAANWTHERAQPYVSKRLLAVFEEARWT